MSIISSLRKETPIILPLFLPIMISQYAGIANGVIDTAMAGALGTLELAAIAVGAAIWVPFLAFSLGTMYGLLIAVSQAFGSGDMEEVNSSAQQGMYLGILLGGGGRNNSLRHRYKYRTIWRRNENCRFDH